jgi:hypothetical protein
MTRRLHRTMRSGDGRLLLSRVVAAFRRRRGCRSSPVANTTEHCCIQAKELPSVAAPCRPKRYGALAEIELVPSRANCS